jgi:nucleotide-binding universal stress UspA family protein
VAGARLAHALARECGARIHALSVVDTRSVAVPPPLDVALAMASVAIGPAVHAEQARAVRAGLSEVAGQPVDWSVEITLGAPAVQIVKEARRVDAALIIVGLRRHGRLERAVHDETALSVMRHADCPVLGVTEGVASMPTRLLVALDFSEASRRAACIAAGVAAREATLVLAYVSPNAQSREEGEVFVHDLGVHAAFARTEEELGERSVVVDRVALHNAATRTTAETLLEQAAASRSELIAAGSVRRGSVDRWLMGSVSTDLVHDGRRSVLIAPPSRMDQT